MARRGMSFGIVLAIVMRMQQIAAELSTAA